MPAPSQACTLSHREKVRSQYILSTGNSNGLRVGGAGQHVLQGPSWLANWPTGFLADGPRCDTLAPGSLCVVSHAS